MATSILIAKIMAVLYLSYGLGFLFNKSYYKKEMAKVFDEPGFMILGGIMALVFGMLIIHFHNIWVWDWTVVITIIGWLATVKGVMLILAPNAFNWFKPMFRAKSLDYLAVLMLVIGLIFGYWGFMV